MATMVIETTFLSDPRVPVLAKILGWHPNDALVALLRVWAVCYEREVSELSVALIDEAARHIGFASALVREAELGVAVEGGVRLAGAFRVHEKVEIVERARARTRTHSRVPARALARSLLSPPIGIDLSSSESESEEQESERIAEELGNPTKRKATKAEMKIVTDVFTKRFREASKGLTPKWGKREFVMVAQIVASHGVEEIVRRIDNMFTSPPRWMKPPFTLGTLVRHFDQFVITANESDEIANRQRGKSGLASGRVEPKTIAEMDPRPPWEIKK